MKANIPKQTVATCTECGKDAVFIHRKATLHDDIEHTYLECEQCGHKATICYTDAEIKKALEVQQSIFRSGNQTATAEHGKKVQAMMDALQVKMVGA